MMRFFISLFILVWLSGCGYKPLSSISKNILGNKIYAHVKISTQDPRNTVLLQDAVNEAIVSRLGDSLVSKNLAQTTLDIKIKSVDFRPIIYDKNGYVISYKTKVVLDIVTTYENGKNYFYKAQGEYDFPIEANSVISDTKRFQAIKNSSSQALDEYIVNTSMQGYLHVNDN